MKNRVNNELKLLVQRYPDLTECSKSIETAFEILAEAYRSEGKLLIAGNGGSAADAEHIVGELMKSFRMPRPVDIALADRIKAVSPEFGAAIADNIQGALPAIALTSHISLSTAFQNDVEPLLAFAQQTYGLGRNGDVFLGISTSGESRNVICAAIVAKSIGMKIIGLTGAKDSSLAQLCDVCIKVPQTETYKIQELHLPVYHTLCLMLEEEFFGEEV